MRRMLAAALAPIAVTLIANAAYAEAVTENTGEIEAVTILDDSNCAFIIEGTTDGVFGGYAWNVHLENKTDTKIMFVIDSASVNGLQLDPIFAADVEVGETKDTEVYWFDDFSVYDIGEVTDVDFSLRVYDNENWGRPAYIDTDFSYAPSGEQVTYNRKEQPTDQVLADDENCTVIVTGTDSEDGYSFELYLVNKTDNDLLFSIESAELNEAQTDPSWATLVMPGSAKFETVSWSKELLEENKIKAVNSLIIDLRAFDEQNASAENVLEGKYEIEL